MGTGTEFFRYKYLFNKGPTVADRDEALNVAGKIRCDVCRVILSSLASKAVGHSEDDLADALEGNVDSPLTGDNVHDQMLKHKKGCNKHFKDELVGEGWVLRTCKDVVPGRTDMEPCLHNVGDKPSDTSIDSYELWKEALFYACEQTVTRYSDD